MMASMMRHQQNFNDTKGWEIGGLAALSAPGCWVIIMLNREQTQWVVCELGLSRF